MSDALYTADEVARKLKISVRTVRALYLRGDLGYVPFGRAVRITQGHIDAYIKKNQRVPKEITPRTARKHIRVSS